MSFSSGVLLGMYATLAVLLVAYVALMYVLHPYPEGRAPYVEEFMDLEEVKALHRAYPAAGPGYGSSGRLLYTAAADDGSLVIELEVHHKHHSFEVTGMSLSCRGPDGRPVWSVDEDILYYIDNRRCF